MNEGYVDKLFNFIDTLEISEADRKRLVVLVGFACGEERKEGYEEGCEETKEKLKKEHK